MIEFVFGFAIGGFFGVMLIALVSINRFEEDDDETN